MNRSLANVIFGGMGTGTKPVEGRRELCEVDTQLCHTVRALGGGGASMVWGVLQGVCSSVRPTPRWGTRCVSPFKGGEGALLRGVPPMWPSHNWPARVCCAGD